MKYVRYKVVNSDRYSCFAQGKYKRSYMPGNIVKADIKTHGIMVFKDYDSAYNFKTKHSLFCAYILRVQPFGRAKKVNNICQSITEEVLDMYHETNKRYQRTAPPHGTLCYHAVEVLT